MLNPSTADATVDDPTIRRCIGFSQAWGYGALRVCNLFALRSPDPEALLGYPDPIGPLNEQCLHQLVADCGKVVVAWGSFGNTRDDKYVKGRARGVVTLAKASDDLWCLGQTKDGSPRHPLYVPKSATLQLWTRGGAR